MNVLVTGASGFIGQALLRRLLAGQVARVTAIDQHFDPALRALAAADPRCQLLEGDFADPALLARALQPAPGLVFHLASVPGSRAEREPALGLQVNLLAPITLLHALAGPQRPRVVFASSVAVYGSLSREQPVDETAPLRPSSSYGAHKRMTEILLADLSRRGELDGVSLRLPGVVARPPAPTGHGSAFMSELIRHGMAGEPYDCPVSAEAQAWWMSLPCCVDNLLHAAGLAPSVLPADRCVQLPVLAATVAEVVAAMASLTGRVPAVRWQPDERIEAVFGRQPPLHTPRARALGFHDDGSLSALLQRALPT